MKSAILIIALMLFSIALIGCSKQEKPLEEYQAGTVLSVSLSERQILDAETFAKEMRAQNKVVEVRDLNMPKEISFIMRKKNISQDTRICFADNDCVIGTKCITQCKYVSDGDIWDGRLFFCNIDQFKEDKNMEFMADFGFCLDKTKWPY
jgi:hypothetical protein